MSVEVMLELLFQQVLQVVGGATEPGREVRHPLHRVSAHADARSSGPRDTMAGGDSILRQETDSNFGFNFPWWDRIFRSYRAQPDAGHEEMTIGIDRFREVKELRLDRMLGQPFRKE